MPVIVIIPGIIAAYVAFTQSPAKAFLKVYFPVLFLLPAYYRWVIAGLPDPTFSEAAILPIALVYFIRNGRNWRFTVTDWFVLGFAFCVGFSQFLASGIDDAQNLIFDMICNVILPYALAKALIEPSGMRLDFAKLFVILLTIVAVTNLYEFRFIANPYRRVFDPLFPGDQGWAWITTIRYGFGRAAGPYAHAILCGVIFATGFRLQRWLQQNGYWGTKQKARWLTVAMVAGMIMTQSRGPWLGAVIGSLPVLIGRARNRKVMLLTVLTVGIVMGTAGYIGFQAYVSAGRQGATSDTQETAAYRKELVENYTDIALQRSWWGWGLNQWPRIPGMPSIDNHYLNLALRHGLIALGFFVLIVLSVCIRLGVYCYRTPRDAPGSSLAFAMLAANIGILISIVTVYLGEQPQMLLFIFAGWAEGLVTAKVLSSAQVHGLQPTQLRFRFRRVLA
jgi:hypothetical protein